MVNLPHRVDSTATSTYYVGMGSNRNQCESHSHRGRVRCEREATLRITGIKGSTAGTVRLVCSRHAGEYKRLESYYRIDPMEEASR